MTAPHVRWIFLWRLDGMSTAAIARTLNERRVPSPGVYDRARNPHRQQAVWTLRTVAAILANPRYTGRQVWNRQFTDHREAVPGDKRSSLGPARVWNPRTAWVISSELTHPGLVSDAVFTAAQQITAIGAPAKGPSRRYALTGLLICATCGRRLTAHWTHHKPAYRCRHGHTTAHPAAAGAPQWVYWAQTTLLKQVVPIDDELADCGDVEDLAAYLKVRGLVIVCGTGTLVIEPAIQEPVEATKPQGPVTHKAGMPSRQVKPNAVQLEFALPLQCRRRGRTTTRVLRWRRKAKNPTRSRTKRE